MSSKKERCLLAHRVFENARFIGEVNMRRNVILSLLSWVLAFSNMNPFTVYAEETENILDETESTIESTAVKEAAEFTVSDNESAVSENKTAEMLKETGESDKKVTGLNAVNELTGTAYAILSGSGELVFFRSSNTYTNGTYTR